MKNFYLFLLCLLSVVGRAQTTDTIFANEHHNVAVFFPEKIRQAVVGAENFVFSYSQEHPQYFGLLKASPGSHSNLLAITVDGQIYSYIVAHREKLPQLLHFLKKEVSQGTEIPSEALPKSINWRMPGAVDSIHEVSEIEKKARFYYSSSSDKLKEKKRGGIKFRVNEFVYDDGEVYAIFEVANNSKIDFEMGYLHLYLVKGTKRRNSSYQKVLQEPLFRFRNPKTIKHGERKRFVYVFPKFTVGEKQRAEIELRENKGNREVNLKLNF